MASNMIRIAAPIKTNPPTNPPSESNFSCPYMCSSSGGFIEARVAKSKTMVVRASSNAWSPSLRIAKLPMTVPIITSTRTTLDIAIIDLFNTDNLYFSGDSCILVLSIKDWRGRFKNLGRTCLTELLRTYFFSSELV